MAPSESLCSSDSVPVTRYPKATQCCYEPQAYLPGLGLLGPHKVDMGMHTRPLPSPEDKTPGVGCNLEPTTDTKSSSTLRKLEAVGATTFSVRVLQLSLNIGRAPAQSMRFALLPVAESCGSARVGCRALLSPGAALFGSLDH